MALSFGPLCNLSQTLLLDWVLLHTRGLSIQSVEKLVKEVLLHPGFNISDLHNFNMRRALKDLDDDMNGFKKESINLRLPFPGHCFASEQHAPTYTVEGIPMRCLIDVITGMCEDRSGPEIEWQPFEQFYQDPAQPTPIRVFSEVFDLPAMVEMAQSIQRRERNPADPKDMPYVPLGIMLYSDSTQLSSSGNNTLWPVYVSLANHSRADHARLGRQCQQELMMLPKVSIFRYKILPSRVLILIYSCLKNQFTSGLPRSSG